MSNREKLINLQRRFEKDARYFADKEDYTSFEKVIEDFIVEVGKLNPDINTRDLLSRHLSKASKVKSYSDALQVINSVSSDITILSIDLHGKGEPIFTASEYDKLVRDNNIEYAKNRFEVFKKSFDFLKKNNTDRLHKIDDLRNLYLGNVKNYKDKVFKFPHLVDIEQRKLFDTLKDIITKQVFDTFEKDNEILLSYLSEIAEIGKAYVDRNVGFSDRLLDGYHIQKRREAIGESLDIEKLRRDLDKSNEKNIDDLIDSIKKCFGNYIKGVENLMTEHSKLYNDRIERTRAERVILGGQDEVKGIIERYKKQLEDIITSGLSKDEEIFYSILGELENKVNESNDQVTKELERLINQSIDDAYEYSTNVYSSIVYHLDNIQNNRTNFDDYDIVGLVEDKFYEYAGEYDIAYSKHIKKYADKVASILGKADVNSRQVKQIVDKYDSMFPAGVDGIGKYFDNKISPLLKEFDRHGSLEGLIKSLEREEEIFSNEVSASLHRLGDEFKNLVSGELSENNNDIIITKPVSESRRDTFFEAEEDKKPKISKEEREKLKAQLDNFFADKKEAKATELKKSIADRDKAIEDVILKYSTEKEKIQREYSKNIQAAKSEAEANKLRAERDEELQRLSLEKATSIEDLKERQKKEEASIREKYQTLFDKKLEEYKDSLGDAIHDFAKDIERGIEDGIRKNPIFQ